MNQNSSLFFRKNIFVCFSVGVVMSLLLLMTMTNNFLVVRAQTTTSVPPSSDRFLDTFEMISLSSDSISSSESTLKISSSFQTITKSTIFSIKIIAQPTKSITVEFDGASVLFQNVSASVSFNISFVGNNDNALLPTIFRISKAVFPAGAYLQIWSDNNNNNNKIDSVSSIMNQIEIIDSHFVCTNPNLGIQYKPCSTYSTVNPLVIPYPATPPKSALTQRQNSGNARISTALRIEIGTITSSSVSAATSSSSTPIFNISILRSQIVFQDSDISASGSADGSCALFVAPARRPDGIKKFLASTSAIQIQDCTISTNVLGFQPPRPNGLNKNPNLFSNITLYHKESAAIAIGDFTFEYMDSPATAPNIGNSLTFVSVNISRVKISAVNAIESVIGIAITNVDISAITSSSSSSFGRISLDFVNAQVFSDRSVDFTSFAEGVSIGNVAGPLWNNNNNNLMNSQTSSSSSSSSSSITIQNSEFVIKKTFVDQDPINYQAQMTMSGSTVSVNFVSVSDFATILFQNITSNTSCGLCTGSAIFLGNVTRITNQVAFDQLAVTSHVRRGFQNNAVVVQLHFCPKLVFTRLLYYDGNDGVPLEWGWGAQLSGLYYLHTIRNVDLVLIDHRDSVDYAGVSYGPVGMIGLGQFSNCGSIIIKNFKTAYVKSALIANLFGGKPLLSTNISLLSIRNLHFVASAALVTTGKQISAFFNGNSTIQADVFEVINCSMIVIDVPSSTSNFVSALFVMTGSSGGPYLLGLIRVRDCNVSIEEGKSVLLFSTIQIGANADALPTAASTEGTTQIQVSNVRSWGRASMVFFLWCAGTTRALPTFGFKDPPMLPTPGVVAPFGWIRQIEISACHSSLQRTAGFFSAGAHINVHASGIVKLILTGNIFDDVVGGTHAASLVPAAVAPSLIGRTFAYLTGTIQQLDASKDTSSNKKQQCNKYGGLEVTEKMVETELHASSISYSSVDAAGCEGIISHTRTKNNNNNNKIPRSKTQTRNKKHGRRTITVTNALPPNNLNVVGASYAANVVGNFASSSSLVLASPSVALDAGRALASLSLSSRCRSYADQKQQSQNNNQLRQRFINEYLSQSVAWPKNFLGICFGPDRGACIRGSILSAFVGSTAIFLVLAFVGFLKHSSMKKNGEIQETAEEKKSFVTFLKYAKIPSLLGNFIVWQFPQWIVFSLVLVAVPESPLMIVDKVLLSGIASFCFLSFFFVVLLRLFYVRINAKPVVWIMEDALMLFGGEFEAKTQKQQRRKIQEAKQEEEYHLRLKDRKRHGNHNNNKRPSRAKDGDDDQDGGDEKGNNNWREFLETKILSSSIGKFFALGDKVWTEPVLVRTKMDQKADERDDDDDGGDEHNSNHDRSKPPHTNSSKNKNNHNHGTKKSSSSSSTSKTTNISKSVAGGAIGSMLWNVAGMMNKQIGPYVEEKALSDFIVRGEGSSSGNNIDDVELLDLSPSNTKNQKKQNSSSSSRNKGGDKEIKNKKFSLTSPPSSTASGELSTSLLSEKILAAAPIKRFFISTLRLRLSPFYFFVSTFWCFVVLVSEAVAIINPDLCDASLIVTAVMNILSFSVDCYLRPFAANFRNVMSITSSFCLAVGSSILVFSSSSSSTQITIATVFIFTSLASGIIVSLVSGFFKLAFILTGGVILLRTDVVDKLEELMNDNVEAANRKRDQLLSLRRKKYGRDDKNNKRGKHFAKGAGLVGGVNLAGIFGSTDML